MSDIDAHVASNSPALTPVKLVHTQTSLNSEGNSDNDSNELREDIEITIDQADAWGFGGRGSNATAQNVAAMPVHKDSEVYNMNHRRRGLAIVFNHKHFDPRLQLKQRNGTDADRDNLRQTLNLLDFTVNVYNDASYKEMEAILQAAAEENHADADCIVVCVLSHGELGILYANDQPYKPDRLWSYFNAEKCPSLAGKPKLFFVQACQGDQLDTGVKLKNVAYTETDAGNVASYKIPSHADFLIAYSTIPGFYSWRNTTAGSWFVQSLCHVLSRTGTTHDLLSNMTRVARRVAFEFQSNTPGDYMMHEKKQIPCITSMLTRDIFFHRKQ